ncbi:MAG: hypothetical protein JWP12_69 [Bacteroidetes bacterium]|nr:hypothetical protein [Bacteroidota bacterium]
MRFKTVLFLFLVSTGCFSQVVCDLTLTNTIQTFDVYNHNPTGVTMYKAKMYIDADGSPRAYGPGNSGLDYTANAGSPGNWWGIVTDAGGTPIIQGSGDPYPGMYVSTTSLVNSGYASTNPFRYVNSETVPFFVLPSPVVSAGGIRIGDVAYVYNTVTGLGCYAIYADAGPSTSLGEGSIYLAAQIGVNPNVRTGGTSLGIIDYIVFPHSGFGQGVIPGITQIDSIGNAVIGTVGGTGITNCLGATVTADHTAPTTQIAAPANWDTTGFSATFNDADNTGGSGVEKRFYQVSDYNNSWRSNNTQGFFNDDFDLPALDPEWTNVSGNWTINAGGYLEQSDESLSNTNLYAPLTQNLSDEYLYNWTGIIKGAGVNRRAGFHFFADQPDSTNRGNSYFVFFRLDDQRIQIYKVIGNSWGSGPVKDVAYSFNVNQAYDFKVLYNRISGVISVYVNNVVSAEWIDAAPISNGSYVSFRSANCNYQVNDFKVYRSRDVTENITVGAGNAFDVRYQNADPESPTGCIRSIVVDTAKNISTSTLKKVNVDWSAPSAASYVNDGLSADQNLTYDPSQLQANWDVCSDSNSGIKNYYYAIGSTPGAADVVSWTPTLNHSVTVTGLTLIPSATYYTSVQAEDSAQIRSAVVTSNGQTFDALTSVNTMETGLKNITVYPNPGNGLVHLKINAESSAAQQALVIITDLTGKEIYRTVLSFKNNSAEADLDISGQNNGMYYVIADINGKRYFNKIILNK